MLRKKLSMVLITLFGVTSLMLFNSERINSKVHYVSLRYNFKKGDEFIYKIVTKSKMISDTFPEGFSTQKETMFLTVKVPDVNDEGVANLEISTDFGIIQSQGTIANKSPRMGKKLYCNISRRGHISHSKGDYSLLGEYIFFFIQDLPDRGLKVGDKWSTSESINYEILALESINEYKCFKITKSETLKEKESTFDIKGISYLAYEPKTLVVKANFTRNMTIQQEKFQYSIEQKIIVELL